MTQHELKIWPQFFRAAADGSMTFQIRKNDRNYQPGDLLVLREFEPEIVPECELGGSYTDAEHTFVVNRVFDNLPGLEPGYVAMTIRPHVER